MGLGGMGKQVLYHSEKLTQVDIALEQYPVSIMALDAPPSMSLQQFCSCCQIQCNGSSGSHCQHYQEMVPAWDDNVAGL